MLAQKYSLGAPSPPPPSSQNANFILCSTLPSHSACPAPPGGPPGPCSVRRPARALLPASPGPCAGGPCPMAKQTDLASSNFNASAMPLARACSCPMAKQPDLRAASSSSSSSHSKFGSSRPRRMTMVITTVAQQKPYSWIKPDSRDSDNDLGSAKAR